MLKIILISLLLINSSYTLEQAIKGSEDINLAHDQYVDQDSHIKLPQIEEYRDNSLQQEYRQAEWQPFRVTFNYENIEYFDEPEKNFIIENLMEPLRKVFYRMLKVKRNPGGIDVSSGGSCSQLYPVGIVDYFSDLIIYVTMTNQYNDEYLAKGTICEKDPGSFRPIIGQINLNQAFLRYSEEFSMDQTWDFMLENQIAEVLHEITHILGFSSKAYQYFQDENLETKDPDSFIAENDDGIFQISSDYVLAVAKQYFNCQSLEGLNLEKIRRSQHASSHWSRNQLGDEIMTNSKNKEARYSIFTLALLQDSGWYEPNYDMADEILFGYKEQCDFVKHSCRSSNKFIDFCYDENDQSCTQDGTMITKCKQDSVSIGGCKYWEADSKASITEGNQRCFTLEAQNRQLTSQFFKYVCYNRDTEIIITINDEEIVCIDGSHRHIGEYTLKCPQSVRIYCQGTRNRLVQRLVQKQNHQIIGSQMDGSELCDLETQWACKDGKQCIPRQYYCDGSRENGNAAWEPDCIDGSDEELYFCCNLKPDIYLAYNQRFCPQLECPNDHFQCENGVCIPEDWVCDNPDGTLGDWSTDCADGSDEDLTYCCANGYYDQSLCQNEIF